MRRHEEVSAKAKFAPVRALAKPDKSGESTLASSPGLIGYRFGSFVLDLEWGGLLAGNGKEKPLRPKSFALLCMLAENAGRVISHDAIMSMLWPDLFVTENNVTQCIHEIRRALGSEASQTLQTLPRRGYRFTPNVTAIPLGTPRTHLHDHQLDSSVDAHRHSAEVQTV
jgi:DNA-binding winged helix-turn-helix (wHTH) protein